MNTLTTQAVEKLLQRPDVKVIRNPLHNEAVNITIIAITLIWLGLLLMIIMESIETPDLWKSYWTLHRGLPRPVFDASAFLPLG